MLRRLLVVLQFPVLVGVGVLLQSVALVALFLVAEMIGLESILNQLQITKILFGLAFIVSLYWAWRVCRKKW